MREQENRIFLILVVLVGTALLYPILSRLTWEKLETTAITLGGLFVVTWSLVGVLWLLGKINQWFRRKDDSNFPPSN